MNGHVQQRICPEVLEELCDLQVTVSRFAYAPLPEVAVKMGAPPHWTSNLTVDDVAVRRVKELGGKVYQEPGAMLSIGRVAVIADPQAAFFALHMSTAG
ncbi:MAG: hypothetical protein Q8M65_02200 [Rhodoglobus sp.]|nr:hypothetical protein [Rhodoglobus sp.]